MKGSLGRWVLWGLRIALCAVAVFYLWWAVPWFDRVTLAGTDESVRLLEDRTAGGELLIRDRSGVERTVPVSEVRQIDGTELPDITYGVRGVLSRIDAGQALFAILLFLPVPFMSAMRLVWMLAVQEVRLTFWESTKLTFAGNFFNFAMPGTVGGDLIKAYYVTRYTHHKTEAVTTIFLDRVIGLLGLMFLASATFVVAWGQIEWDPAYRNTVAAGLGLIWLGLALGAVFVFSARLRHAIRMPHLAARLPAGDHLLRIGRATVKMRQHKVLVALALLITVALQLLVVISAYEMSRALHMEGSFALYFICVPIGFLIAAVPISPPQAFGVMEAAYVQFFAAGGLNPASVAVVFALANRLIQLVWALPGVLVPLLGAHRPSRRALEEIVEPESGADPDSDPGPQPAARSPRSAPGGGSAGLRPATES